MNARKPLPRSRRGSIAAAPPAVTPGLDRAGDPLPPDALLRLGTVRHRESRRWSGCERLLADGKTHLVGRDGKVFEGKWRRGEMAAKVRGSGGDPA
jgi:hypothetical protein